MTLRYLNKGQPVDLASGFATTSLTPDTGQYWIPRLIRVGVTQLASLAFPNNQPALTCALFHGGVGDTNVDAYVDGTGNGLGDVTALMNGTLIQTGEYLTASWQPFDLVNTAFPTAQGYLQIIGLTADSITEATGALATAAPGPGFGCPIPNSMQMPPAGHVSSLFIFNNPGQGNTVVLINPSSNRYLYIYNVNILAASTVANADGNLEPVNGVAGDLFAYFNPSSTISNIVWDFHGLRMNPNGLQWRQQGNAPANSMNYSVNTTHRFMPF